MSTFTVSVQGRSGRKWIDGWVDRYSIIITPYVMNYSIIKIISIILIVIIGLMC